MADDVRWEIKGAEETLRRLRSLAPNLQRRGLRRAARRAMIPVREAAKTNARALDDPNTPSQIWRNIAISESARAGKREGGVVMRVGVRGGARSSRSRVPPWYWRLVELGTQHTRARPFMLPALMNNAQAVGDKFTAETNRAIDEEIAKGVR